MFRYTNKLFIVLISKFEQKYLNGKGMSYLVKSNLNGNVKKVGTNVLRNVKVTVKRYKHFLNLTYS